MQITSGTSLLVSRTTTFLGGLQNSELDFQMQCLTACEGSAIDNATRGLLALGELTVTFGLYCSLGHSTIVIVVVSAFHLSSSIHCQPTIECCDRYKFGYLQQNRSCW